MEELELTTDRDPGPGSLGRYQIIEEAGVGMMGVVYRARDPVLDRIVALKSVRVSFALAASDRERFEQRFLVEARAAAALSHPGIVTIFDCGKDAASGSLFIALEYLEGRTLAEMLAPARPLEWRLAVTLTAAVARTLAHAHQRGIVHRDIKPANLMVLPTGQPKIMDFGIAKMPSSALTQAQDILGTPSYMSPEQTAGEPVDGRSDLFSLGAVLYACLTGRRAFEAPNLAATINLVLHTSPVPPSQLVEGLPDELDGVVSRALARNPRDRFQTADAFAQALEALLRQDLDSSMRGHAPVAASGLLGSTASSHNRRLARLAAVSLLALATISGAEPDPPTAGQPRSVTPPAPLGVTATTALDPAAAITPPSGRLEVAFKHSLKQAVLQVFVDDRLLLSQPLEKDKAKKLLITRRRGEPLAVPPGSHNVRVRVQAGDKLWSQQILGTFKAGATLRLDGEIGGLFKKKLSLAWAGAR